MSLFYTEAELSRLKNAAPGSRQARLYAALRARTLRNTAEDTWVQSGDTQVWYHLCWERMADAAFVWAMEGGEALGQWIHNRTMDTVRLDIDAWIGPWYRNRQYAEPTGALESAHITIAVCEAYENARALFTADEQAEILTALREKGLPLCMRYAHYIDNKKAVMNWHAVLLNGYATAAVVLGDREAIADAHRLSKVTAQMYNIDSYGESVQYSNYASIAQSHLNELLLRGGCATQEELTFDCYTRLMQWYAYSYLYQKELPSLGGTAPRTINFGDSAAAFRPSGDILAQVAVRMKDSFPTEAALAAWLFAETYSEPEIGPDELATFGFFNQYGYLTVLMEPDMAAPKSPSALSLPLDRRFACGHIIARDRWEKPQTTIALSAGYDPYNVVDHRHLDQNSFQLIVDGERMLIDPGHCCYRLHTQAASKAELAHNTISIEAFNEAPAKPLWNMPPQSPMIPQRMVSGTLYQPAAPMNRLLVNETFGDTRVIVSDATDLYGDPIRRVLRIWVWTLPDMIFVADVVTSDEPVSLWSHFALNNRDGKLDAHVYNDHRLVFRRHGRAIKLFEAASWADGELIPSELNFDWGYVHDFYHPLANQAGQGREGSALIYNWRCPKYAREHLRIHTIAVSDSKAIRGYHVREKEDGFIRIEAPDHENYIDLHLVSDSFTVRRSGVGERTYSLD